jgi:hypothetical protein
MRDQYLMHGIKHQHSTDEGLDVPQIAWISGVVDEGLDAGNWGISAWT